jgi:hypothetical protein
MKDIFDQMDDVLEQLSESQEDDFINYFSVFSINALMDDYYNDLANRSSNTGKGNVYKHAFNKDLSREFKEYIKYRVGKCKDIREEDNANVNILIFGEQYSGKSTYAYAIFLLYKEYHKRFHNRDVELILTFNDAQTLDAYATAKKFTMILQDETDELKGPNSQLTTEQEKNIIRRARFSGISLIKLCPDLTEIAGCDYALLPMGFHIEGSKHFAETGNPKECYARALLYLRSRLHKKFEPRALVYFKSADAINYMKSTKYIDAKKQSWDEIKENRGGQGANTKESTNKLKAYAQRLFKFAISEGWNGRSKKILKTYLNIIDPPIPCGSGEIEDLLNITYGEFMKGKSIHTVKSEDEEGEDDLSLQVPEKDLNLKEIEENLLQKKEKNARSEMEKLKISVYRQVRNSAKSFDEIGKPLGISAQTISNYNKEIEGALNDEIGHKYEIYYFNTHKHLYHYSKHYGRHNTGKPDCVFYGLEDNDDTYYIYSIKCLNFCRTSHLLFYTKIKAEIEFAKKLIKYVDKPVIVRVHVYNRYTDRIEEFDIEPEVIQKLKFERYSKKSKKIPL